MILGFTNRQPGFLFPYIFIISTLLVNLFYFGLTRSGAAMLPVFYLFAAIPLSMLFSIFRCKPNTELLILVFLSLVAFTAGYGAQKTKSC